MPLIRSASPQAFSKNVATERNAGKPSNQSLAIAYRMQNAAKGYAFGGIPGMNRNPTTAITHAEGMIRSPIAGRTDRIPLKVRAGSYVIPADVVSGLGQGNSMSGGNALNKLFGMGPYGASMSGSPRVGGNQKGPRGVSSGFADGGATPGEPVDIVAAGGEFVVPPEVVMQQGGGDLDHGHNILDELVKQVREKTIRQLRNMPGPKQS